MSSEIKKRNLSKKTIRKGENEKDKNNKIKESDHDETVLKEIAEASKQ